MINQQKNNTSWKEKLGRRGLDSTIFSFKNGLIKIHNEIWFRIRANKKSLWL